MEEKTILLLANSRKAMPAGINRPGRCLAGIDLSNNQFVRLVSDDEGNALDWDYFEDAKPGWVAKVYVERKAMTIGAQTENWVIAQRGIKIIERKTGYSWIEPYAKGEFPYTTLFRSL